MTNEEKLQKIIDLAHQVLADMEYEEVPRLPIEIHVWVDGGCKNPGKEGMYWGGNEFAGPKEGNY